MKKSLLLTVILSLLFSGMFVSPAKAAPSSYTSTFRIVNLESTTANVSIAFYDSDGNVKLTKNITIDENSGETIVSANQTTLGSFDGSVVVSSDKRIASTSNIVGKSGTTDVSFASYSAFSGGASTTYLPLLMKDNWGYNTFFSVQNFGSAATNITVTYTDGTTATYTGLKPGASHKFDQASESHTAKVFAGKVTSTDSAPIGAAIVEVGPTTLFSFSSFSAGATSIVMPLINQNNWGYFTGVGIQNLGDVETQVEVSYMPSVSGTACTEVRKIPAGASVTFSQHVFTSSKDAASFVSTTCKEGETFIGSGQVTNNSANVPLVAVVNQLNGKANKGAAYNAFTPSAGQQKLVFPLIMDRNYGYFTSWSISNVGGSEIAKDAITCTVKGTAGKNNPVNVEKTFTNPSAIATGSGWTLEHRNVIGDYFVGSASCLGPTGSLMVGSVNQLNASSTIDSLLVYEGFAVVP